MAVVDGNFRVYGTNNLGVVDTLIFYASQGFYCDIGLLHGCEKASDVILADARA